MNATVLWIIWAIDLICSQIFLFSTMEYIAVDIYGLTGILDPLLIYSIVWKRYKENPE